MKKSRYSIWEGLRYGNKVWGINDSALYGEGKGQWNISGHGYVIRSEAIEELKRLRTEEQAGAIESIPR